MRVSYICPQCNGMLETAPSCPRCGQFMEDNGRIMDLFDDYSPYLEIEGTKLVDGLPDDAKNHKCPHVFACPGCGERTQQLFDEVYYS